jgi:hypothetical protein
MLAYFAFLVYYFFHVPKSELFFIIITYRPYELVGIVYK